MSRKREARFQSARDLAFGLEVLSGTSATVATVVTPRPWRTGAAAAVLAASLFVALAIWLMWGTSPSLVDRLVNSKPKRLAAWPGNEEGAEISPDGDWVVFLSDKDGEWDLWRHRVGTVIFDNLTKDFPPLTPSGSIVRKLGFSADGSWIWFNPGDNKLLRQRIVRGKWVNPVWSPDGKLIVYAGRSIVGQVDLQWVTPDGTPVDLPHVAVRPGGYRFLPNGNLLYLPRIQGLDFWLLDLATGKPRQLTSLSNHGAIRTFDITPDGKDIVFDRSRQNSDIVLFDLSK